MIVGDTATIALSILAIGKRTDAIQSFQTAVKLDPNETGAVEWLRTLST
jgi:hypothetical protein